MCDIGHIIAANDEQNSHSTLRISHLKRKIKTRTTYAVASKMNMVYKKMILLIGVDK